MQAAVNDGASRRAVLMAVDQLLHLPDDFAARWYRPCCRRPVQFVAVQKRGVGEA